MDNIEQLDSPARFISLQVTYQMPGEGQTGRVADFLQGFLDFVFAEVGLAGGRGGTDGVGGERLGNGDQEDRSRIAPDPAGSARDSLADAGQPGAEIEHYFFSASTNCLAIVALGPDGASLR